MTGDPKTLNDPKTFSFTNYADEFDTHISKSIRGYADLRVLSAFMTRNSDKKFHTFFHTVNCIFFAFLELTSNSAELQRPALSGQKRTPGRAKPPESAIGVPSARQQAAPVICPSSPNAIAFMPPPTCGII